MKQTNRAHAAVARRAQARGRARAVAATHLVVEAVHLCDLPRLVVAADQRDAVGVANLEREQQQEGLDRVEAAVDEIAHEEIVCVGHVAADLEELLQVVKLPVNVAADLREPERTSTKHEHHTEKRGLHNVARGGAKKARTVTGASTRCTLLSSTRISRALAHRALTSASLMYSHRRSCSIWRSRSEVPAMAVRPVGQGEEAHALREGRPWRVRRVCWVQPRRQRGG